MFVCEFIKEIIERLVVDRLRDFLGKDKGIHHLKNSKKEEYEEGFFQFGLRLISANIIKITPLVI